jgi:hypothetical protein
MNAADFNKPGGKAKPLKAAKKDKRELDEDDKAFHEKKRAGTCCFIWAGV